MNQLLVGLFSTCSLALFPAAWAQSGAPDAESYRRVIDLVLNEFAPEIRAQNATTEVVFYHNSSGMGAFTWRKNNGKIWEFHFYDGVLRVKNISNDVLSLIACHELGHHLAGYPFKESNDWSSAEGQADYFATHACAPRLWRNDDPQNSEFAHLIAPVLRERCDSSFAEQSRRGICYRSVHAVDRMRFYEGHGRKEVPSLFKPDPKIVQVTEPLHPSPQCRIDTHLAGVFCSREFDFSKIPGHLGQGRNTRDAELDSAESHCEEPIFSESMQRPRCWFAPLARGK